MKKDVLALRGCLWFPWVHSLREWTREDRAIIKDPLDLL